LIQKFFSWYVLFGIGIVLANGGNPDEENCASSESFSMDSFADLSVGGSFNREAGTMEWKQKRTKRTEEN
jgi:hypothetical protein